MTDERDIAQDKKKTLEQRKHADGGDAAVQPQPGKKPAKVDDDTEPSNSRARELYKQGEHPRDHSHESTEHPPEGEERIKPNAPRHDASER